MKKKIVSNVHICDNCNKISLCPDYTQNLKFMAEGFSISIVECETFENKNFDISEMDVGKV